MGSHHKRNEGMKPVRRTAAKPKPEKRPRTQPKDERALALLDIQQAFLDRLSKHFQPILEDEDFDNKLQQIKGHFFRREYSKVFSDRHSCELYSVRYLPSRALAYANLFAEESILHVLYPPPLPRRPSELHIPRHTDEKRKKVVAVGAGVGSELSALHLLNHIKHSELDDGDDDDLETVLNQTMEIDIVDSAEYQDFLKGLNRYLHETFQHTPKSTSNEDTISERFKYKYHRQDILSWSSHSDFHSLLSETTLLTFMFVFNELFAASKLLTMHLIAAISKHLPIGSHVLLIESAGDLSKVTTTASSSSPSSSSMSLQQMEDGEEKQGLMVYKFWDHLPGFEKVLSRDRQWYRLDLTLRYPLELENVGYFVRLYRRIK